MRYKSLIISNLDLSEEIPLRMIHLIKKIKCERLILSGGFVENWLGNFSSKSDENSRIFFKAITKKILKQNCEVVFLTDKPYSDLMSPKDSDEDYPLKDDGIFKNINFCKEVIISLDNKKYLISGEDHIANYLENDYVERLKYSFINTANIFYNSFRVKKNLSYRSLFTSNQINNYVDTFSFPVYLADVATAKGCSGIICSHHKRSYRLICGEQTLINTGFWCETGSALVEDYSGKLILVSYKDVIDAEKEKKRFKKVLKSLKKEKKIKQ